MIWNSVRIYSEGDPFLADLLEDIHCAQSSVCLEFYIFSLEGPGEKVLAALVAGMKRGVKVRLLVDGVGSYFESTALEAYCHTHEIDFKVYNPVLWSSLFHFSRISRINRRNHRKFVIIDKELVHLGSRNMCAEHFASYSKGKIPWKDLSVRVTGGPVLDLYEAFVRNWTSRFNLDYLGLAARHYWPRELTRPLRINDNLVKRIALWRDTLLRLHSAQRRVWIMNAYFVPHRSLLNILKHLGTSGIEVHLYLPKKSDVPFVRWASIGLYAQLLKKGVRIFEYEKSVLHTKAILVDDVAIVGSHNLNHRSLIHDLECEVVIEDIAAVHEIEKFYGVTKIESTEVCLSDLTLRSPFDCILSRLALSVRYFL